MDNLLNNNDCLNSFFKYIINRNTYHENIEILYILCHTCHDFRETILSKRNHFPKKKELMIVYTKFISIPRMYNKYSYKINNYQKNILSNTRKKKNIKRSKVKEYKRILHRLKERVLPILDKLYELSDEEFEEAFLIEFEYASLYNTGILKTYYFSKRNKKLLQSKYEWQIFITKLKDKLPDENIFNIIKNVCICLIYKESGYLYDSIEEFYDDYTCDFESFEKLEQTMLDQLYEFSEIIEIVKSLIYIQELKVFES
tara:strand:- start:132 stop:902 length:771 start_codon:yes stop_codon:yes gene_type:complete